MAKGRHCRGKYVSKGERSNVSSKHNFDTLDQFDRALFRIDALRKGKRVCHTIPNPNKEETNKPFIRVVMPSLKKRKETNNG